jgi:hypothetical protein
MNELNGYFKGSSSLSVCKTVVDEPVARRPWWQRLKPAAPGSNQGQTMVESLSAGIREHDALHPQPDDPAVVHARTVECCRSGHLARPV